MRRVAGTEVHGGTALHANVVLQSLSPTNQLSSVPSLFAYRARVFCLCARRESRNFAAALFDAHEIVWKSV